MITRVAVVPYPPLLIPELTVRSGAETGQLRGACLRAVSSLTEVAAEWVAVGVDRFGPAVLGPATTGSFSSFGVDVPVSLSAGRPAACGADPLLPLPALVTGWLRAQAGAAQATAHLLAPDLEAERCREYGRELAAGPEPVGLLVLADGTNCRTERSPNPPDERAEPVDELLRTALAEADAGRLLELDATVAAQVGVEGRAALHALAGAAEGGRWRGKLLYSDVPFGVTYHVAVWSRL
ncbi:hypothetical protein HUO13_11120 [Saccharopolyspora erythraea]|nr:hypothetical protein HUO13_11120 [Saccharopolyspora erythraea]